MVVVVLCLDLVGVVSYLALDQEVVEHLEDRPLVEAVRHLEAEVGEVVVVRHPEDRLVVGQEASHLLVSAYLEMVEGNQAIE